MTLTAEQSSNKARFEAAPTAEIINIIRTAMGEGCIRPCHVYDAVDELICRIQALESKPKRNCDVGTAEEQRERFTNFCTNNTDPEDIDGWRCDKRCPLYKDHPNCKWEWLHLPYESEVAK